MIRPSVSLFSVRGHFGMWSCGYHVSWGISGSRRRVQLAAAANGRLGVFPGEWGRGRFEGARAQSSAVGETQKRGSSIAAKPIPQTDAPGADQNSTPRAAGSPEIEGLTRWPALCAGGILRSLDYAGSVVFSVTGAHCAMLAGLDLLGCVIVGVTTAVGGGTFRDVVLGKQAFWVEEYEYLLLTGAAALFTFLFWNPLASLLGASKDDSWLFWADSVGIGAFCCIGAIAGVRMGAHPVVAALCGMFTSTFGGVVRDVLTRRPPRILHNHAEIYALPAFCGSSAYLAARAAGLSFATRSICGFATAFSLRVAAWTLDLRLPSKVHVQ